MQLSARQPDGSTLREHLQAAAAAGMPADARLHSRVPACVQSLWQAFVALDAARVPSMGASPILASELVAWQQLHGVRLSPWEAETLQAMDRAAQAQRTPKAPPGRPQ